MRVFGHALLALAVVGIAACGGADATPEDRVDAGPDAAPACALPPPGTRCASEATLEQCVDGELVTTDCAAEGSLCGADPVVAGGAACVKTGDGCGRLTESGECTASVLTYCEGDALVVEPCAARGTRCEFDAEGGFYDCQDACTLAGVTAEGACEGAQVIRQCDLVDGLYAVVDLVCPEGTGCRWSPTTTGLGCLPSVQCDDVEAAGRCDGDLLTRCVGGEPVTSDCAEDGLVCGFGGAVGFACTTAGETGAFGVSGVVRYEDREPRPDGTLGPLVAAVAPRLRVAVIADDTGEVLATGQTAADGSYALRYDAAAGTMVHVLVATVSPRSDRPLRVIRSDGRVHGFGGASAVASAAGGGDLLVSWASGVAEAVNVYDQGQRAMDVIADELGVPAPLTIVWQTGASEGTYASFSGGMIFLLGEAADDDGYDDTVILHEIGHYVEGTQGGSDSPGGFHDGSPTDPRLAWSEGFSTYFAMAVRGQSFYADSKGLSGGWGYDAETSVSSASASSPMTQNVAEDFVSEILWDMTDEPLDDDDQVSAGRAAVLAVQRDWLRPGPATRGVTGVDLVDWLDGFFAAQGTGSCAGARDIVTVKRRFPYDYPACPP